VSGPGREPVVVIGIGNEFRRDDGAGPAVVGRLRGLVPPGVELVITDGEPTRLIEAWFGRALALVVDAVRSEPSQPGRVHRFVLDRPGVGIARTASSHGFGLDDAIALAVALDRMPGRLIVHAIEAADLTQGTGLTSAVAEAVGVAVAAILDDIGAGRRLPTGNTTPKAVQRSAQVVSIGPMLQGPAKTADVGPGSAGPSPLARRGWPQCAESDRFQRT
jgi:hydrogenase maturation protease